MGRTGTRRAALRNAFAGALAVSLMAGGCGEGDFANRPRPAPTVTVSAVITPRAVSVSPSRVAAGTIELRASNQTSRSQRLELRSERPASDGRLAARTTRPIGPGATATLKAVVAQGSYVVSTRSSPAAPASLVVAPPRGGARDRTSQP